MLDLTRPNAVPDRPNGFGKNSIANVKNLSSDSREGGKNEDAKKLSPIATGQILQIVSVLSSPPPDISILSDQFLAEVRVLQHKNVAAELLAKLLKDEVKER